MQTDPPNIETKYLKRPTVYKITFIYMHALV